MRTWTQRRTSQSRPVASPDREQTPLGNREAQSSPGVQRSPDHPERGHDFSRVPNSNQGGAMEAAQGRHEQEANRIGRYVARHGGPSGAGTVPAGNRLPAEARALTESLLGEDFSGVRVHADDRAGARVNSEGAVALTQAEDLHFAPWAYRPDLPLGRGLIAHELVHVAQQRRGRNGARDAFLSGAGREQALQGFRAERRAGEAARHWSQISPEQGLTPAPPGMSQRCVSGCSSCNEEKQGPSPEEVRKAQLKTEAASLKTTLASPQKASFGEFAAAEAKSMKTEHSLAVLERGYGTHVGNQATDTGQGRTPAPVKTDCTEYTVSVLRETFNAKGQGDAFKKILSSATKESGGGLKGTKLIDALRTQAGWKVLYWNPDTNFVDTKADGSKDTEHTYSAHVAKTKGTYYGVPIEKDKLVADYSPHAGTKTSRDTTALDKLRKIPFGVIAARGGMHIAMLVSGVVYEVHWTEQCTSERVFEATPLESWAWLSGIVAAPASDIDNAWK